tara:strand:+ start:5409 stop:5654 length:246 start_codon:yes stop_codon:yes gene_type:complete
MNVRTAEEREQDFTAMGHSVELIFNVISGDAMAGEVGLERQSCVDRNTEHLELMVALTDWDNEDMTACNLAITAGNGYTAS